MTIKARISASSAVKRSLLTILYRSCVESSSFSSHKATFPRRNGAVYQILTQLEYSFGHSSANKTDDLISYIKSIHDLRVPIPLEYFTDLIKLLAQRNDAARAEVLLQLSKTNVFMRFHGREGANYLELVNHRSNPTNCPHQYLVSFTISQFFRLGHSDSSLRLWMRMASAGFTTSRSGLEGLLLSASTARANPPIEFIDKIHNIMTTNSWNQSASYYSKILNVLHRFLIRASPASAVALSAGHDRLVKIINEAVTIVDFYDVSLSTTKLSCWLAILSLMDKMQKRGTPIPFEMNSVLCIQNIISSFDELLQAIKVTAEDTAVDLSCWLPPPLDIGIATPYLEPSKVDSVFNSNIFSGDDVDLKLSLFQEMHRVVGIVLRLLAQHRREDEAMRLLDRYLTAVERLKAGPSAVVSEGELSLTELARELLLGSSVKSPCRGSSVKESDCNWTETKQLLQDISALSKTSSNLKNCMTEKNIPIDLGFYLSWIAAIPLPVSAKDEDGQASSAWESSLAAAVHVQDECLVRLKDCEQEEKIRVRSELCHAIVCLLARSRSADALLRARGIIGETLSRGDTVLDITWSKLLLASSGSLSSQQLSEMLTYIDSHHGNEHSKGKSFPAAHSPDRWHRYRDLRQSDSSDNLSQITAQDEGVSLEEHAMLSARLVAYSKLQDGFNALQLLRYMRRRGIRCGLFLYMATIRAMSMDKFQKPSNNKAAKRWSMLSQPTSTVEWLLREMLDEGLLLTAETAVRLLDIFAAAASSARRGGGIRSAAEIVSDAESFLQEAVEGGIYGHPPVRVTEDSIRGLVKVCCTAGLEERAFELIEGARVKYDLCPSAASFSPIIYNYAVIQKRAQLAEDVLTRMTNEGIKPNQAIVDALVEGLVVTSDAPGALDLVQELHNQFSVSPSVAVILRLLDRALAARDMFEARRVVVVIDQLFGAKHGEDSTARRAELSRAALTKRFARHGERLD